MTNPYITIDKQTGAKIPNEDKIFDILSSYEHKYLINWIMDLLSNDALIEILESEYESETP